MFHHFFITNCVVLIAGTNEYRVHQWRDGKNVWEAMKKKHLKEILDSKSMTFSTKSEFKKSGKTKKSVRFYSWFLDRPDINQLIMSFKGTDFTNEDNPEVFPVWQHHAHEIVSEVDMELIAPFLDHVYTIICDRNKEYYEIEMKKNAWMFQNPLRHMGWATVLVGEEGAGKNRYTDILCKLWGDSYCQPNVSVEQVTCEKARAIVHHKKLIVCNELPPINTKQGKNIQFDTMKTRITEDALQTRSMYHDFGSIIDRNVSNYILVTNHTNSLRIDDGDRRYFILNVSSERKNNHKYLDVLFHFLKNEKFLSHLLSYFLQYDTTGLDISKAVETELRADMIDNNRCYAEEFIRLKHWRKNGFNEMIPHHEWVNLNRIWGLFVGWLQDDVQTDPARDAGAQNKFFDKIRNWVEKKNRRPAAYRPNARLIKLWEQEGEEHDSEEPPLVQDCDDWLTEQKRLYEERLRAKKAEETPLPTESEDIEEDKVESQPELKGEEK
jgi:hypothetical protein